MANISIPEYDYSYIKKLNTTIFNDFNDLIEAYLNNIQASIYVIANSLFEKGFKLLLTNDNMMDLFFDDESPSLTQMVLTRNNTDSKIYIKARIDIDYSVVANVRDKANNKKHALNEVNVTLDKALTLTELFSLYVQLNNYYSVEKACMPSKDYIEYIVAIDNYREHKSLEIDFELEKRIAKANDIVNGKIDELDSELKEIKSKSLEQKKELQEIKRTIESLVLEQNKESASEVENLKTLVDNLLSKQSSRNDELQKIDKLNEETQDFRKNIQIEQEKVKKELDVITKVLSEYKKNAVSSEELKAIKKQIAELNKNKRESQIGIYLNSDDKKVNSLLRRVEILIEDKDFNKANKIIDEDILNIEPENPIAYLYLVVIENELTSVEDLVNIEKPISNNPNYIKALRFADDDLKEKIQSYNNVVVDRIYVEGVYLKNSSKFDEAIKKFDLIRDFKDSEDQIKKCKELKKEYPLYCIYIQALKMIDEKKYESAITKLNTILEYKDSKNKVEECKLLISTNTYKRALALIQEKKYESAVGLLNTILDYKDSKSKIEECRQLISEKIYNNAISLMNGHNYEKALGMFAAVKKYKNSQSKIDECNEIINASLYKQAINLMNNGCFKKAIDIFNKLGDYKDSKQIINEYQNRKEDFQYDSAMIFLKKKKYQQAAVEFAKLKDYKDSKEKINECKNLLAEENYKKGNNYFKKKNYSLAYKYYNMCSNNYKDCIEKKKACEDELSEKYYVAIHYMDNGKYSCAIPVFKLIEGYKDVQSLIKKCKEKLYNQACYYMNTGNYEQAVWRFQFLKNYKSSEKHLREIAKAKKNKGKTKNR